MSTPVAVTNGLGVEDLLFSQNRATVQQVRGNRTVPVTPLNAYTIPFGDSDKSIAEMLEDTTTINEMFETFKSETATKFSEADKSLGKEVTTLETSIDTRFSSVSNRLIALRALLDNTVESVLTEVRTLNTEKDKELIGIGTKFEVVEGRLCKLEETARISSLFDTALGDLQRIDAGTRLDKLEAKVNNLECNQRNTDAVIDAMLSAIKDGTLPLVDGASKDVLIVAINNKKESKCQE